MDPALLIWPYMVWEVFVLPSMMECGWDIVLYTALGFLGNGVYWVSAWGCWINFWR